MDELQLEAEHSRLKVHKVQAEHEAYIRKSRENYEEKVKLYFKRQFIFYTKTKLYKFTFVLSISQLARIGCPNPTFYIPTDF